MQPARLPSRSVRAPHLGPLGAILTVAVLLSGCVGGLQPPAMLAFAPGTPPADLQTRQRLSPEGSTASPLVADLAARRSILPEGGAFARIATATHAAAPQVEAAELGLARLKAEAAARNGWPTITPSLSLDGIAGLAARLVVDQPLFDHGRRDAQRDRAAAELDLAAVTLSARQNQRAFDAVARYLDAERARHQAAIAETATARLAEFHRIVTARIKGGLSDRTEEQIIAQTIAEMQATLAADRQTRLQALADLQVQTGSNIAETLSGLDPLPPLPQAEPLAVLRQQAEGIRDLAEARITRASALPGLSASATVTEQAATPGLTLGGVTLGLGSPATLAAAAATPDLVARQTEEARRSALRTRTEAEGRIATLRTRQAQGAEVLRQTLANLDLYAEQYRLGRRSLTDLTAQTAAAARLERDQAALAYDIARLELEIARDAGLLLDGARL
ncbi:MAG: TolC family protein [Rhodobacteraceae bacterium]|nr:TolC family protein [Paracoccaceae bacterium]